MAAVTFVFLLLLLLSAALHISAVVAAQQHQQRSSNISLGSSLSPFSTNSSWLSPSGRFAFGFYPQGNGFAIGIWFAQIPELTVVCTANRDDPPLSSNATLVLTSDGRFILEVTPQDQEKLIADISQSAYSASMLDTGNFVLYNSSGSIIWQSFDHFLTDTLLPGQRLLAGQELVSSLSETDHSTGRFRLKMQNDGNLVQYPIKTPDTAPNAYWTSWTDGQGDNVTLNFDDNGFLYLLNSTGFSVSSLFLGGSSTPVNRGFYRMTIDVDGIFRVYSLMKNSSSSSSSSWSINWASSTNNCDPKGVCGLNGYCTLMDQRAVCKCIPGFNFIDQNRQSLGCHQAKLEADQGCGNGKRSSNSISILENTVWEDDQFSVLSSQTEAECKDACLADGNCEAATFKDQECRKQKLPLRYGRRVVDTSTTTTLTFVKVFSCSPTNSTTPTDHELGMKESKNRASKGILIITLAFSACTFMVFAFSGFLVYQYRVWAYTKISDQAKLGLVEEIGLRSFTYVELEKMTEDFKEVVGRGAFSTVFKGTFLSNNGRRIVAVKRLDKVLDEREREFQTEMRIIAKTHHKNLVQLIGYCCDGPNRLLVYEYMSNGSLADFLFKSEEPPPCWHERVGIALNIARGILYLHEECDTQIIHCDIKPQNILLDEYQCPKIADFGLSKLLKADQTRTQTGIRGTRGYVAPEWHRNLPVTLKADIYSFGVLFLELLCCRKGIDMNVPEEETILTDWVYDCFESGELGKLVGEEEVDKRRLDRMVRIGIWCIQDEPSLRPSMKKVVLMLEGTVEVPIPPSPISFLSSM
ncbi:G-type lectin S-receptor-like serine/threonine-protein kinase LECRK3 [Telopea speciosissima]|uniref:G-type lectin S-receptor-like serine/threonine-protein kinase LECRK3 n=1 Tax=Telopea speciosissima TaxID=54955 RepID=UPI001CC728ED|nr:G-type lectin S-receptor-like serine/threonine-protein kinase LECRK3 [Telopea speciosissima]